MAIRLNDVLASKMVDIVTAYLSGTGGTAGSQGMMRIYNGTQPTVAGGTSGTLLVAINGLSWTAGTGGSAAINATKTGTCGVGSGTAGTASWGRLSGTDGTGYIIDGSVGTASTSDFVIDAVSIVANSVCSVTAATIVQPVS